MYPAEFSYLRAESVHHALAVLAQAAADGIDLKVLAGGQSLLPMMKLRLATPEVLLDIGELAAGQAGWAGTDAAAGRIGALATYRTVWRDTALMARYPALRDALAVLADPQVRARGTVGGALAHADPAADLTAVLLALDAELTMVRAGGVRTMPLGTFLRGVFETALADDELIAAIHVPPGLAMPGQAYLKAGQPASHLPLAGVCVLVGGGDGVMTTVRVAVTGVAGRAFRATAAERALTGQRPEPDLLDTAAALVSADAPRPLTDVHASGDFRLHLARVLTRRALQAALERAR